MQHAAISRADWGARRELRGSVARTVSLGLLVAVAMVLVLARNAYADMGSGVWYRSNVDNGAQYIVGAGNRYDAAAYICGYSQSDVASWDLPTRNKLSTQQTTFKALAESMNNATPWNEDSLWDSLESGFSASVWSDMTKAYNFSIGAGNIGIGFDDTALTRWEVKAWQDTMPSYMNVWSVDTTPQTVAAAREALDIILNGGNVGTGQQPTIDGNTITFVLDSLDSNFTNGTSDQQFKIGNTWYTAGYYPNATNATHFDTMTFELGFNSGDNYKVHDNYDYLCYTYNTGWNCIALEKGTWTAEIVNVTDQHNRGTYQYLSVTTTANWYGRINYEQGYPSTRTVDSGGIHMTVTNSSIINFSTPNQPTTILIPRGAFDQWSTPHTGAVSTNFLPGAGGSGGDGGGDSPWPEPEPEPDPPNVPEPPVVNPPPITGPDLPTDPPQDPTITPEPEPTGTDYTVYLKAIIRQLNQVMVQMSNHCKHIRDQISTSANAIISNLHTFIEDLQESIDSNFSALNDYLQDLTKWYESFMGRLFDDVSTDLDTIKSLLRQILRKMGIRGGSPKEVEKDVDDDFDFLQWLINFILSKVGGVIEEFVGDVGALINGIKDKFPFSIPWDIAAILAILDGVPVTPRFTVSIPALNGWWQQTDFVVDLTPYDSVAAAVRLMFNAWWVLVLAMKTNWMLDIMGDSTSIGQRFANRVEGGGDK